MCDQESTYIKSAIELAKTASRESVRPNPFVGALVINQHKEIVGKGFHKKYGDPHAEVFAIREAMENGADLSTCTLIVTLEPCSHTGKTPPCTDLIISSGIRKVIVGSKDPNPLVNGIEVLRQAGIEAILEDSREACELNREFFINQRYKRPYILAKAAITADHFMARENGDSKWISSEESRSWAHLHCRSKVDAILTTAKTVLADDAKLNVRTSEGELERTAIVIDRNLSLLSNPTLSIHYPRKNSRLYLVTDRSLPIDHEINYTTLDGLYTNGMLAMKKLLADLYLHQGIYSVLIEAGPRLLNQLLQNDLIDELIVFESPIRFNNPTDRYRLDLSYTNRMEAQRIKVDGPDRVTTHRRVLH